MMTIERNDYDQNYPFAIRGGWGDEVYCTLEGLKDLKSQIEKILEENKISS